jgi:cystathionine beta-lyase/cystathionine gamma-synthase
MQEQTENRVKNYLKNVLENMPADWLRLTTHRLDIYNELLAKTQFIEQFDSLYQKSDYSTRSLSELPTAFDYIRLGHPLSCILEWGIADLLNTDPSHVICFASNTMPILSVLRTNSLANKNTQILCDGKLPASFDAETVRRVYNYQFDITPYDETADHSEFEGSTILVTEKEKLDDVEWPKGIDFLIQLQSDAGSIIVVNGKDNTSYVSDIQHVRRRESIAMTPSDCLKALESMLGIDQVSSAPETDKNGLLNLINSITNTHSRPLLASSGLSIQYAIMMGLINDAMDQHEDRAIRFIVPPNCYGGTNDQARRVAACMDRVSIMDLPVDGDNNMVDSIDSILDQVAQEDAVPYIIAEIPTNPRVEVPDLNRLKEALGKSRHTPSGAAAVDPVFILDQTFCPNVHFFGELATLNEVRAISYVSGSKFPSGGKCTAGYCVANQPARPLLPLIEKHLKLCDNEATPLQVTLLAEQMPSMNQRIQDAYENTRAFVNFIRQTLPDAKINFVSDELASEGFTPSVFSLDLPSKGSTPEEKEAHKRMLNHQLINRMITEIPEESKYCVSYGQLKGCYWTIPATSTQGTTKEGDKDYIARVSVSPDLDLDRHMEVFRDFAKNI